MNLKLTRESKLFSIGRAINKFDHVPFLEKDGVR